MKISPRSLKEIAKILREEEQDRKNLSRDMYKNRQKSNVNEALMVENPGSLENLPKQFAEDIDDDVNNFVQSVFLGKIRTQIFKALASHMRQVGHIMSPTQWEDQLDNSDVFYGSEMELLTDIRQGILKYAEEVMAAAVESVSEESEEATPQTADVEPKYSEYE